MIPMSFQIPIFVPVLLAVSRSTVVGIVAVSVGMAFFWALYFAFMVKKRREEAAARKAKSAAAPKRSLFEDLCQTHALSAPGQSLLRELSKSLGLSSPTLLLVEPKHLQARAEQGGDSAAVASKLVEKLFGDLAQLSA